MIELMILLFANLMFIPVIYILLNQINDVPPVKAIVPLLVAYNVVIVGIGLVTGYLGMNGVQAWYDLFYRNVQSVLNFLSLSFLIFVVLLVPWTYYQLKHIPKSRLHLNALVGFILFSLALLIWIPHGFNSYPHQEIWAVQNVFNGIYDVNVATEPITRLSNLKVHFVAELISSTSFVGYNTLHFLLFWMQGLLVFLILRHLRFSALVAFSISALMMFYPGVTEVMSLRILTALSSSAKLLVAVFALLVVVQRPTRINIAFLWFSAFASITTYEAVFLPTMMLPVLLFFVDKRITPKLINVTILWYAMPFAYIIYYYLMQQAGAVYGIRYVGEVESILEIGNRIVEQVSIAFSGTLMDSWLHALNLAGSSVLSLLLSTVATLIVFAVGRYLIRQYPIVTVSHRLTLFFAVVIILFAGITYGIFFKEVFLWRVHWHAALSGTLIISTIAYALCYRFVEAKRVSLIYLGVMCAFFFLAFNSSFRQYRYYWQFAGTYKQFFAFTEVYDLIERDAVYVFTTDMTLDEIKEVFGPQMSGRANRTRALQALTGIDFKENKAFLRFCLTEQTNCRYRDDGFVLYDENNPERGFDIDYDKLVLFSMNDDLSVTVFDNLPTIDAIRNESTDFNTIATMYQPWHQIKMKS